MHKKQTPSHLQSILWSIGTDQLDLDKNRNYIIHQVLMYGQLSDINWLFEQYPHQEIQQVFLEHPQPIYTKPALNFLTKFILNLTPQQIDWSKYIKHVS